MGQGACVGAARQTKTNEPGGRAPNKEGRAGVPVTFASVCARGAVRERNFVDQSCEGEPGYIDAACL